jgi:hypothetical protein
VLNLSEESNGLLVLGNAGHIVNQGAGWTAASAGGTNGNGISTIDGQTYQIYSAGQAALLVGYGYECRPMNAVTPDLDPGIETAKPAAEPANRGRDCCSSASRMTT